MAGRIKPIMRGVGGNDEWARAKRLTVATCRAEAKRRRERSDDTHSPAETKKKAMVSEAF